MRKKFTLLLASLFLVMGTAWALPTEGQLYRIKSVFTENYLDITSTQTHGIKSSSLDALDVNQCFYFIPKEGSVYYIKSANNQYVATDNNHAWNMRATDVIPDNNTSAEITLVSVTDVENQYYLHTNNTADWGHCIATQDGNKADGAEVFSDKAQDDKSKWEIVAVTEVELTELITAAKGELASVITEAEDVAANACLSASDAAEKAALSTAIATAKGLGDDAKIEDITAAIAALQPAIAAAQQYIQLHDFTYVTALGAENSNHPLVVSTKRSDWGVGNNATSMSTISKLGLAASAIDAKQQFAIITPDDGANHYIYSVNAKRFLKKDNTFGAQGDAIQLNDASANGENRVQFQFKGTSLYINVDNSNPRRLLIDGWDDVDDGNACEVRMHNALTFDLDEALDVFNNHAVINVTYKLGDKKATTSEYKAKGETYSVNNPYGFTSVVSCTNNGEALAANNGAYSFEITGDANVVVEIQENLPFTTTTITDGNFAADTEWYLLRQRYNDHYWEHDANDNIVKVKNGGYSIYEAKQLWCFTGNAIDGFKVYNKAAGATFSLNNESPAKLVNNNNKTWEVHPSTQSFTANDARFGLGRPGQTGNNQYANLQSNSLKSWSLDAGSTTNAISVSAQYAEIAANWEKMIMAGDVGSIIGDKAEQMRTLIDAYVAAPSQANEDAVTALLANVADADRLQLKEDSYYMVVSADGRFLANQSVEKAIYSDGTDLRWGTKDNLNRSQIWKAIKVDDKWRFQNFKDMLVMVASKTNADDVFVQSQDDITSDYTADIKLENIQNTFTQWNVKFEAAPDASMHAIGHGGDGSGVSSTIVLYGGGSASDPSAWRLIEVAQEGLVAAAKAELSNFLTGFKNNYYDGWAGTAYKWRDQSGVNNYTIGIDNALTLEQYYNNAKYVLDSQDATSEALIEQVTILENVVKNMSINQPEVGKFYRVRCIDGQKRLQSIVKADGDKKGRLTLANNTEATTIFLYDGNGLLSYTNGLYMDHRVFKNVGENSAVTFAEAVNGKKGCYVIKVGDNYIYGAGDILDSGSAGANGFTDKRDGYNWWLEEVTTLPVNMTTIGESSWATLYAPVALNIPAGVTAYTGKLNNEKTSLTLIAIEEGGIIPAKTAVILEGAAGAQNFAVTTGGETIEDNALAGTVATIAATGTIYTLQREQKKDEEGNVVTDANGIVYLDNVVFGQYTGDNLNGFRAYLPLDETVAGAISIRFEGSTDIENVEIRNEKSEMIFDLLGRRVEAITKGGIYIVNGKKVVVK